MLCTSCGFPTSTQESSSTGAKAAADRRREQNRRAQQRFRQKHRQRKAASDQDQSHQQDSVSNTLDDNSPVASSPLTPPSTVCTIRRQSSIDRYEETRGDDVIDWNLFLDPNDRYGMGKVADDFWTSTLKETASLDASNFVSPTLIIPEDCRGHYKTRNPGDSVDNNESDKVQAGPNVLHRAVRTGNSKVVRLLLEHNADCNSKDNAGLTPLLCAIIGGHEEVLELLLSHGAGIEHVDNAHRSALHWAVLHNRHRILKRLLGYCGGDVSLLNRQNKDGETPLSVAVGAGSEVAVKLLLEFGATVNVE
ncbi:ankyrin repeat-containing domain protein [Xylaria scruposa]|nr:ankyrin repeat-containing domain protein [Xylaria scruposa]